MTIGSLSCTLLGSRPPGRLARESRIYVAGHRGLVGSAIWRQLAAQGFTRLIGATSAELDLRSPSGRPLPW